MKSATEVKVSRFTLAPWYMQGLASNPNPRFRDISIHSKQHSKKRVLAISSIGVNVV